MLYIQKYKKIIKKSLKADLRDLYSRKNFGIFHCTFVQTMHAALLLSSGPRCCFTETFSGKTKTRPRVPQICEFFPYPLALCRGSF